MINNVEYELEELPQTEFIVVCGGQELARYFSDWLPDLGDEMKIFGFGTLNSYIVTQLCHIVDPAEKHLPGLEIHVQLKEGKSE